MAEDSALGAYEQMAPFYDDFTAHHDYEGWIAALLEVLERHGLQGKRLLDVACGTGKSFLPMLPIGWRVTGCDLSPAMLELAAAKSSQAADLHVADLRGLPRFGEFDLVWALDDAINYMLGADDLVAALVGLRSNLAKTGLLLFDVNETMVYETFYSETSVVEHDGQRLLWRGLGSIGSDSVYEARFEVEGAALVHSIHRQRYFPESAVLRALQVAGLDCLGVYGQGIDGDPVQPLDPTVHTKAIYVTARSKK